MSEDFKSKIKEHHDLWKKIDKLHLLHLILDYGNARFDQSMALYRDNKEFYDESYAKAKKLLYEEILNEYSKLRAKADCCKCKEDEK